MTTNTETPERVETAREVAEQVFRKADRAAMIGPRFAVPGWPGQASFYIEAITAAIEQRDTQANARIDELRTELESHANQELSWKMQVDHMRSEADARIEALEREQDRLRAALQLIRDSNRHAKFCTWTPTRKWGIAQCSPGCPVLIAREATATPETASRVVTWDPTEGK